MFQTQRARARHFNRSTNPPALAGDSIERALAVGAIGEDAAATVKTGFVCGGFRGRQQQQLQLRNAGFITPGFQRQVCQLFTVVKGENAQLRPCLAAAGDAMEMVETIVDIRTRHRFCPRQIVVKLGFGRHCGRAAVA